MVVAYSLVVSLLAFSLPMLLELLDFAIMLGRLILDDNEIGTAV
jgi:hypothetical protein